MARKDNSSGGGAVLLLLVVLIWFVMTFFWWILAGLSLVASFFLIRAVLRAQAARRAENAAYCAEIAARADQQHEWVLRGDDRGIYGPAAELTRSVLTSGY